MRKMRSLIGSLSVGILAAVLTAGMAGSASAADPVGYHEISSTFINTNLDGTGSHECLDVVDGSTSVGQNLQIFHCHGTAPNGAPQLFGFLPSGAPSTYMMVNKQSNLCLQPDPGQVPPAAFTRIKQEKCVADSSRSWVLEQVGSSVHFRNVQTNLCLGAFSAQLTDHNPIVLQNCGTDPRFVDFQMSGTV